MITGKMIVDSLDKYNPYYDECYGCHKQDTDGWGDELCTTCQKEFDKNIEVKTPECGHMSCIMRNATECVLYSK